MSNDIKSILDGYVRNSTKTYNRKYLIIGIIIIPIVQISFLVFDFFLPLNEQFLKIGIFVLGLLQSVFALSKKIIEYGYEEKHIKNN